MELLEILEKRQSIRRYKEGEIPEEHIREIVGAAGTAPSGKNLQNWHFVIVRDEETKQKIADIVTAKNGEISDKLDQTDAEKGARFRKFCRNFTVFFTQAPVLAVVFSTFYPPTGYYEYLNAGMDPKEDLVYWRNPGMQSLGAALENFTLRAVDLGYGSCWLTSANYAADEISAYLKDQKGFEKENFFMAALMSLGIPQENQPSPKKKSLDEICTFV